MQERRSAQHSSRHTVILYLFEVSLLSELLLVLLCCGVCLFLCVCVSVSVYVCRQKPCLTLWCTCSSLSPAHGAVRKTSCATILSVTQASISLSPLPVCLLICSLSSSGDIIHAAEGEKEGYLSAAPDKLQRDTAPPAGEPRTETCRDAACTHNMHCI